LAPGGQDVFGLEIATKVHTALQPLIRKGKVSKVRSLAPISEIEDEPTQLNPAVAIYIRGHDPARIETEIDRLLRGAGLADIRWTLKVPVAR